MKSIFQKARYIFYVIAIVLSIKVVSTVVVKNYNKCVGFIPRSTVGQSIPVRY